MKRKIKQLIRGRESRDGAGVKLLRVLDNRTVDQLNPFLMLDAFDSKNYEDFKNGFPIHPHRGIETITYIHKGSISHEDSLGNRHTISDGQAQWMIAGSGILHSETFKKQDQLQGVQLWLNMPRKGKMAQPEYVERSGQVIDEDFGRRRIISSKKDSGSPYTDLLFEVLEIGKAKTARVKMDEGDRSYLFPLIGDVEVEGEVVEEKSAAILSEGKEVEIVAKDDALVLVLSAEPLQEPWAWAGPIVMNTEEEVYTAFWELDQGTFVKDNILE